MSIRRCARTCVRLRIAFLISLLAWSAGSVSAQRNAGDLKVTPYVFENSKGEKIDAEFGVLLVPENRSKPQSNLIELGFVRFKSTSRNPGPPIVYLAGGPGGSGSGTATGSRFPLFMAMREIGDVIAFDQRGTGSSKPNLGCFERLDLPLDVVPSRDTFVKAVIQRSDACKWYWETLQRVDLTGYNTNESADDLNDLRRALGVKQISLWAISYGTHLALTTIKRHPQSVHRAILAGTEGPDHTYKLPSQIQKHLTDLAQVVKADPVLGKEIPDLLGLMSSVMSKLDREPVVVTITDPLSGQPVKVTVNKFVMQKITADNIGTTDTAEFPGIFYAASKGDYTGVARYWLNQSRRSIGSAMSFMMDCASGLTAARREQINREMKATLLEDLANQVFPDVCVEWEAPDLGDAFRAPVKADVPVLFISGTLDARTPVGNAEEYRAGFSNSTHLIIEGAVHSDPLFLSSPKIKDGMLEFLKGTPVSTTRIVLPAFKFAPLPVRPEAVQRSQSKALGFVNGQWFDGQKFRPATFYSINGFLTSSKPAQVDSTIDLKGKFVVPPFGEAHNHNLAYSSDEQFAQIKRMYLEDGIFYVKNPNSLPRTTVPLIGKINVPTSVDAVFANGGLTVTGGHLVDIVRRNIEHGGMTEADGDGGFYFAIDTLADLDRKWDSIKAGKPDFVKTYLIYSEEYDKRRDDDKYYSWKGLNPAILPEIVRRAHDAGLRVSTHVETAADFHNALVAGVDEINHLPGFRPPKAGLGKGYDDLATYRISEADARLAASRKVVVVTTIGETIRDSFDSPDEIKDPKGVRELLTHNLQILNRHGVRIAIGGDSFRETSKPEALNLNRLGAFDTLTLLKMWCEYTAEAIFPNRKLGYLRDGYEASFLVLSANPLLAFENVSKIEMRVKQGEILSLDR
jgi:pimeloyl-ACP methyl ester carboxylesterase/imidazolonepropionase-like amidohydrolase